MSLAQVSLQAVLVCGMVLLLSRVIIRQWFNEKERFMARLSAMSSKSLEHSYFDRVN